MPQAEGVHRLKEILVEEVSLVDRAANKRRFLLVKRDGSMDELRSNGRGGFTRVAKAEAPSAGVAEEEEKRKREDAEKAGKPFPGAAKPFGAGGEKDGDDEKEEKQRKADASGQALAAELQQHVEDLEELIESLNEHEEEEPSDVHMSKLAGVHKKMGALCEKYGKSVGKRDIDKRGAKMSAARLETFNKAIASLQSLLSELMDSPAKESEHKPDPGDPQVPPKGWSPTNPSGVPTGAAGTAGGVTKSDAALAQIAEICKRQGDTITLLTKKLAQLERAPAPSNATPVQRESTKKSASADVSWPLNMNDHTDRASVDKSTSFHDAD